MWLVAIGVVGAMIGFLDLMAIPTGTRAFRTGLVHMSLNLVVTLAYVGNFFWRHTTYGNPGPVAVGPLVLSVLSLGALAVRLSRREARLPLRRARRRGTHAGRGLPDHALTPTAF